MILIAPNHVESGSGRIKLVETASDQGAVSGKYVCNPGDVIYSKIRPALRKACMVDYAALCSADMYPLRAFNELTGPFLLFSILSEGFSRLTILESERVAMPKPALFTGLRQKRRWRAVSPVESRCS
jgi:type I restriction enzyme S subunit